MKLRSKLAAGALALTVLTAAVAVPTIPAVHAAVVADTTASSTSSSSETSTLSKSYVVYGAGVSSSLYSDLNDVMDVDSSYTKLTATGSDYATYINDGSSTTDSAMVSSVAITPAASGSGVKVNIKKYNGNSNITKVTAQQYAMVAQMAGITDITITVTANRAVTGESALTGVYKAFAADGHQLNSQNTTAANSVLEATQDAIVDTSSDSSYAGKLMAAVGNTSKEVAQKKQAGTSLTVVQIEVILKQQLAKQGISSKTTASQRTEIAQALLKFENSPIASSSTYVSNVSNTINNVKNSTGNLMSKAKSIINSDSGKQAVSWFQRLINWVKSLFTTS